MIRFYPVPDGTMSAVFKKGDTVALRETTHIEDYLVYLIETKERSLLRRVFKTDRGLVLMTDPDGGQELLPTEQITGVWQVAGTIGEAEEVPHHHHYCEIH